MTRRSGLDALRVLGVLAIVAGHTWTGQQVVAWIFMWHVPVFFMLSGYLWKPGRAPSREWASRLRTLLLPYAVWLVLIGLGVTVHAALRLDAPPVNLLATSVLGGSYASRPYSAFWFVTALVFVTLALRHLERWPRSVTWAVAVAVTVVGHVLPELATALPLSLGLVGPCLLFAVLGQSLAGVRNNLSRSKFMISLAAVTAGFFLSVAGIVATPNLKTAHLGDGIATIAVSALLCAGLIVVADGLRLPPRLGTAISTLGRASLAVVLGHALVLHLLGTPEAGAWPDFLLALTLPWAIGLLALRGPGSRLITGQDAPAVLASERA